MITTITNTITIAIEMSLSRKILSTRTMSYEWGRERKSDTLTCRSTQSEALPGDFKAICAQENTNFCRGSMPLQSDVNRTRSINQYSYMAVEDKLLYLEVPSICHRHLVFYTCNFTLRSVSSEFSHHCASLLMQCHRVKADLVAARFLMRLTFASFISTNKRNHWAGRKIAESVSKIDEKLSSRLKCRQFILNPTKNL